MFLFLPFKLSTLCRQRERLPKDRRFFYAFLCKSIEETTGLCYNTIFPVCGKNHCKVNG